MNKIQQLGIEEDRYGSSLNLGVEVKRVHHDDSILNKSISCDIYLVCMFFLFGPERVIW